MIMAIIQRRGYVSLGIASDFAVVKIVQGSDTAECNPETIEIISLRRFNVTSFESGLKHHRISGTIFDTHGERIHNSGSPLPVREVYYVIVFLGEIDPPFYGFRMVVFYFRRSTVICYWFAINIKHCELCVRGNSESCATKRLRIQLLF